MYNCEVLKNAVVIQTVKDYRKNMKKLQKNPTDEEAQQLVKECREFLLSDRGLQVIFWYQVLQGFQLLLLVQSEALRF